MTSAALWRRDNRGQEGGRDSSEEIVAVFRQKSLWQR